MRIWLTRRMAKIDQAQYDRPRKKVEAWMRDKDIWPLQAETWVYPTHYPFGCTVVATAEYRIWVFRIVKSDISIIDIQHVIGFHPSGAPILLKGDRK